MANSPLGNIFADPGRSQMVALILGGLGGPLVAIGIAIESVSILVVGAIGLAASGAVWAIRGIKEDEAKGD